MAFYRIKDVAFRFSRVLLPHSIKLPNKYNLVIIVTPPEIASQVCAPFEGRSFFKVFMPGNRLAFYISP